MTRPTGYCPAFRLGATDPVEPVSVHPVRTVLSFCTLALTSWAQRPDRHAQEEPGSDVGIATGRPLAGWSVAAPNQNAARVRGNDESGSTNPHPNHSAGSHGCLVDGSDARARQGFRALSNTTFVTCQFSWRPGCRLLSESSLCCLNPGNRYECRARTLMNCRHFSASTAVAAATSRARRFDTRGTPRQTAGSASAPRTTSRTTRRQPE
jgi:hypothetical protein